MVTSRTIISVCLVKARGIPRPHHEIKYVAYYKLGPRVRISGVTGEIIEKYYAYKKKDRLRKRQTSISSRLLEWLS